MRVYALLHFSQGDTKHSLRGWIFVMPLTSKKMLSDKELMDLNLISPHLTTENQAALLARCKHQSKREIEFLCAQMTLPAQADTDERSLHRKRKKRGKPVGAPGKDLKSSVWALP